MGKRLSTKELRAEAQPEATTGIRILLIDIETQPALAYVWGLWDQNIGLEQVVEPPHMLCWAAKWLDEPRMRFKSTHHHSRREMVEGAWHLLDTADAVMHFNGRRFDIPHLNREFLELGLTPPSPYKQIDLYETAKRRFRLLSNKLAHVADTLDVGGKTAHEGFKLWRRCMNDDKDAWALMRQYNEQDVALLEKVYYRLQPWIMNHPHRGLYVQEDVPVCQQCGSTKLQRRGFARTQLGTYPRYQCQGCGGWSRGKRTEQTMDLRTEAA